MVKGDAEISTSHLNPMEVKRQEPNRLKATGLREQALLD